MILGEQALYTNIGGAKVMREQMERLLRDIGLPPLTLEVLPNTADIDVVPMPGFHMRGDSQVHYELVSSGADITDAGEIALHGQAFEAFSRSACYGEAAEGLIANALAFWSHC